MLYLKSKIVAHQAIQFGENRKPTLNEKNCVRCHLCKLVCPQKAIDVASKRISKSKL